MDTTKPLPLSKTVLLVKGKGKIVPVPNELSITP
jgi:hypothetical protein